MDINRLNNLTKLQSLGLDPYKVSKFDINFSVTELNNPNYFNDLVLSQQVIHTAGRIVSFRLMGKVCFIHISDGIHKFQIYLKQQNLNDVLWEAISALNIGDHLGVSGTAFVTKTNEPTIKVDSFTCLSKSLKVLPLGKEKEGKQWYNLDDIEERFRRKHLDLICNPKSKTTLINRSKIINAVRNYLNEQHYLEVETPILQSTTGGAEARTFDTYYDSYDCDVKLRISLELNLKKLICGDLPRVYEIGKVFRNEGVSKKHNPEFTLLEFYKSYADYKDIMQEVEQLFEYVVKKVFDTTTITIEGTKIDFSRPWHRIDLKDSIYHYTGLNVNSFKDLTIAKSNAGKFIDVDHINSVGKIIEKLLESFVEPHLIQPTFIVGYPTETSPLAKTNISDPNTVDRFEGYIMGKEICNAFSELNNPIEQLARFENQAKQNVNNTIDEEFIDALSCGMPPTGGCGIGIDRMVMLLTNSSSIREVLFFPMMRKAVE